MLFSPEPKRRREDLFDFEEELQRFVNAVRDPLVRMVVVTGLRRTGKTSLLLVGLAEAELPYLYLDARALRSATTEEVYRLFEAGLSALLRRSSGLRQQLAAFLKRVEGVSV